MIGETLGSYRVTEKLSQGGMGAVYTAEHILIGSKAAIKVLLPQYSSDPIVLKRFFNEAKATAAIGHPGIVKILDYGEHQDGRAYLVMEFLDGEPLDKRIKRQGKFPLPVAVDLIDHVASALGAAHDKEIVHRDLKPGNIVLVEDPGVRFGERPKILDFGIAKLAHSKDSSTFKTRTGVVMGTPAYMAPEQCRGAGQVDLRADLYALGCIFFELLCKRPPFLGEGSGEIIGKHQFVEPPAPRSFDPSIPPALDALILRLLAKQPDERPSNTQEVRVALTELFEQRRDTPGPLPIVATQASNAPATSAQAVQAAEDPAASVVTTLREVASQRIERAPRRSRRWVVLAAIVAMFAAVTGVTFLVLSQDDEAIATRATDTPVSPPHAMAMMDAGGDERLPDHSEELAVSDDESRETAEPVADIDASVSEGADIDAGEPSVAPRSSGDKPRANTRSRAPRRNPKKLADDLIKQARTLEEQGKTNEAREIYGSVLGGKYRVRDAQLGLLGLDFQAKNWGSVIRRGTKMLDRNIRDKRVQAYVADAYFKARRYDKAKDHYQVILRIDSKNTHAKRMLNIINAKNNQ